MPYSKALEPNLVHPCNDSLELLITLIRTLSERIDDLPVATYHIVCRLSLPGYTNGDQMDAHECLLNILKVLPFK